MSTRFVLYLDGDRFSVEFVRFSNAVAQVRSLRPASKSTADVWIAKESCCDGEWVEVCRYVPDPLSEKLRGLREHGRGFKRRCRKDLRWR